MHCIMHFIQKSRILLVSPTVVTVTVTVMATIMMIASITTPTTTAHGYRIPSKVLYTHHMRTSARQQDKFL
jgi:hypothetical protein